MEIPLEDIMKVLLRAISEFFEYQLEEALLLSLLPSLFYSTIYLLERKKIPQRKRRKLLK